MRTAFIALVFRFLATGSASAKSVEDSKSLEALMVSLEYSASGGASLAHFEYNEDFFHEDLSECKIITGEDATEQTYESFKALLDSGDSTNADYKQLSHNYDDLNELFESGEYYYCTKHESIYMGLNVYERYIKTDFSYRVEWITGHED